MGFLSQNTLRVIYGYAIMQMYRYIFRFGRNQRGKNDANA